MSTDASTRLRLRPPEGITRDHHVAGFSCGHDSLDNYLSRRALKADAAGDAKVIVLTTTEMDVIGYYAISSGSVSRKVATRKLKKNSPDPIPMALIGRFAIDRRYQGQGLGKALMKDAVLRICGAGEKIGIKGILLHAIDTDARKFYEKCGFSESGIEDHLMMVLLEEIAAELGRGPNA
jgi:GNAT superfamily N-acetyltransferase